MAEDREQKTEQATPRRLEEARESGQVALSSDLVAALMLCTGALCLGLASGPLWRAAGEGTASSLAAFGSLGSSELDLQSVAALIRTSAVDMMSPLALLFVPVLLVGLLVGYGQVGFRITPKGVQPDASKLNPLEGLKRLFGARTLVRTGLAAAKLVAIASVTGWIAWRELDDIARAGGAELGPQLLALGRVAVKVAAGGLIAILVLAVLDLWFQRFQHARDLRMSRQEVKEEYRITEGDPKVKARVRQIQREMAMRRMMEDVPKATVVVTNPTHYAVALAYERGLDAAPRCVAKGKGHIALRIKELARESGVVLYEDVPLARALHAGVEIGREIPEGLYAAVAEVLAYVYRLEERQRTA